MVVVGGGLGTVQEFGFHSCGALFDLSGGWGFNPPLVPLKPQSFH